MSLEIFDVTQANLEKGVHLSTQKQMVTAHNIANASNPNFEPLVFDEVLQKAVRQKGQAVSLEKEMKDLALNSIKYSTMMKLMASKFNILRTIATQGRR